MKYIMSLNAQWIETFTTLCDLQSFTRTAETLHMTQPGVSQHIRKLEAQLGAALIDRDGKGFALTDAGAELREIGLRRRAEEEALRLKVAVDDPGHGDLRIGAPGGFTLWLWTRLAPHLAEHTGLRLSLEAMLQPSIEQQLIDGRLDLGILHAPSRNARVENHQVGRDPLRLLVPPGFTMTPDSAALCDLGFIDHPDGQNLLDRIWSANFNGAPRPEKPRIFLNQIAQIMCPVEAGLGFTVLPNSAYEALRGEVAVNVAQLGTPVADPIWVSRHRRSQVPARFAPVIAMVEALATRHSAP